MTSVDFNQGKTGTANVSDLCSLFDDSSVSSGEIGAKGLKLLIHFYGNYLDKYTRGRSRTPITSKMYVFLTLVNKFQLQLFFLKSFILDMTAFLNWPMCFPYLK